MKKMIFNNLIIYKLFQVKMYETAYRIKKHEIPRKQNQIDYL